MRPGGNPSFRFARREPARTISPVTRALMDAIDATGQPMTAVSKHVGISYVALSCWRHGHRSPRLIEFECVAQALGYRLVLEPIDKEEPA